MDLILGENYSRKEIGEFLNSKRMLFSREGIIEINNIIYLFCTLNKEKKKESFNYNDFFDGYYFHWDSQNQQNIKSKQIQKIVNKKVRIYLFCRVFEKIKSKTQKFINCGILEYYDHFKNTANPVHIIFKSIDFKNNKNQNLENIYNWEPNLTNAKKSEEYELINDKVNHYDLKIILYNHALKKAKNYYENKYFVVHDVSKTHNYDLLCINKNLKKRIEVKFSRGLGETITLTKKEISSAKDQNSITDLFILHSIQIQKENNRLIPNGGIIKIIENWTPKENKLMPATFHYEID